MATSNEQARSTDRLDNWQGGRTLAECNLRMLEEEDSCDVLFQCCGDRLVRAHRYMLMSRSCVFHALLSDPDEDIHVITVPEVEQTDFKQFLVYLYTDRTDADADNVIPLLYTARKYAVMGLENLCLDFLKENLTVDNACVILEAANHFNQKVLYEKALTLIKSKGERSLKSPGFLALSQELVNVILESDDLVAEEHVIFTVVNSWAEAECGRQGREVNPEAKKSALGKLLMQIRFPLMKQSFLDGEVKWSGLLDETDRLKVIDQVISPQSSFTTSKVKERCQAKATETVKMPVSQPPKPKPWGRFAKTNTLLSWNSGGKYKPKRLDAISFQSNTNLELCGCQLYGAFKIHGEYTYDVMTYFGTEDTEASSSVKNNATYSGQGEVFDVMFSRPVRITAGEWYTLAVKITGPSSYRGKDGMALLVCDNGVQFNFKNSAKSRNGTDVSHGQIPALIYRVL